MIANNVTVVNDRYRAAEEAHAIGVLTEWDEFKSLDFERVYDSMFRPAFMFDGRNLLDREKMEAVGFELHAIGKSARSHQAWQANSMNLDRLSNRRHLATVSGMPILTIESTCDETAAAVIADDGAVLGDCVATQETLHERFGGVVPEVAARAHLERILPVIDTAIAQSGIEPEQLDAIAVADRPGLAGSLLVGLVAAKTLALAWKKPLVAINHLHAHLYACQMAADQVLYPCIGLVVSGGHTSMYHCLGPLDLTYLGGTIDDAAGEAFDKVATMLQLGFPRRAGCFETGAAGRSQCLCLSTLHDP